MARVEQVEGFILAGGTSSRMGRDKSLLELGGTPLAARTVRLLESVAARATIVGPPERYARIGVAAVADDRPGLGPLGGIATALRVSFASWNLIVACDLPYLTRPWLKHLVTRALVASAAEIVVPESARGLEPLCAMYHRRCGAAIVDALDRGVRGVAEVLIGLPVGAVEKITEREWKAFDSGGRLFKNMNTAADYEEARERFERKPAR